MAAFPVIGLEMKRGLAGEQDVCGRAARRKDPVGGLLDIRAHREVSSSCGTKVVTVDRIAGGHLKLMENDWPNGQRSIVPGEPPAFLIPGRRDAK